MDSATKLLPALLKDLRESEASRSGRGTGLSGGLTSGRTSRAERTGTGSFLMEDLLRGGIGAKGARDLKQLITPLSSGYEVPRRQDLHDFWERAERHLPGLCADLELCALNRAHLSALGPHLLGDKAWGKVAKHDFATWDEFKQAVQQVFGLTAAEIRRSFKAITKEHGEPDDEFILRVEEARSEGRHSRLDCVDDILPRCSRRF